MKLNSLLNNDNLDKAIFGFLILFASTLNNSIFLCQLGFFGAYLLVGLRFYLYRENPFKKTGLELAFLIYFVSVFISALFSVEKGNAFNELIKSLLLLPIVYLLAFAADSEKKTKTLLKFYLGFSLATLLVYLFMSLKHYFTQLYQLEMKGPSPFQYVMTAGGLMSFTAIFFFAFLMNEKTNWKVKVFNLLAFGLSFAAVIASYTRAAWLGLFAGLFIVLLIKKKWWIIAPAIIAVMFMALLKGNESKVEVISLKNNLQIETTINPNGRAYAVQTVGGDTILVSEYEKGISVFVGNKHLQTLPTNSPITRLNHWAGNYFLAFTLDSRFIVIEKATDGKINESKTFISTGATRDFTLANGKLYVADKDSGLTVYNDPTNLSLKNYFSGNGGAATVAADEKHLALYSEKNSSVKLYQNNNGLPATIVDSIRFESSIKYLWFYKGILLFQNDNYLIQYSIENNDLKEIRRDPIVGITFMKFVDATAYALTIDGMVYKGEPGNGALNFGIMKKLNHSCTSFSVNSNEIYVSSFKRNRVLSMFDPYHETNYERLNIWRVGLKIFKDYPFFGVGDIDLGNVYRKYKDDYLKENFGHLHNNFIQWLVTLGVVGFAAIMFMLVSIFLLNIKIYRAVKDEPIASSFAVGAIASFVGFLASGLGEYNFGDQEILTMVWFTMGLNIAFYFNYLKKTSNVKV